MFSIIRTIIGLVIFGISFLVIKKSKVTHKLALYVVFACISVVLMAILNFVPFENLFYTFDSPYAAYDYCKFHKTEIDLIVEGDACDFVIDREGNTFYSLMIPKTENGWKIGTTIDKKKVFSTFTDGVDIAVYQYKNTNTYFISVLDANGGESVVKDGFNTEFQVLKRTAKGSGNLYCNYYAFIPYYDSQYSIIVNGTEYQLN